jgi:hypothetical protein
MSKTVRFLDEKNLTTFVPHENVFVEEIPLQPNTEYEERASKPRMSQDDKDYEEYKKCLVVHENIVNVLLKFENEYGIVPPPEKFPDRIPQSQDGQDLYKYDTGTNKYYPNYSITDEFANPRKVYAKGSAYASKISIWNGVELSSSAISKYMSAVSVLISSMRTAAASGAYSLNLVDVNKYFDARGRIKIIEESSPFLTELRKISNGRTDFLPIETSFEINKTFAGASVSYKIPGTEKLVTWLGKDYTLAELRNMDLALYISKECGHLFRGEIGDVSKILPDYEDAARKVLNPDPEEELAEKIAMERAMNQTMWIHGGPCPTQTLNGAVIRRVLMYYGKKKIIKPVETVKENVRTFGSFGSFGDSNLNYKSNIPVFGSFGQNPGASSGQGFPAVASYNSGQGFGSPQMASYNSGQGFGAPQMASYNSGRGFGIPANAPPPPPCRNDCDINRIRALTKQFESGSIDIATFTSLLKSEFKTDSDDLEL